MICTKKRKCTEIGQRFCRVVTLAKDFKKGSRWYTPCRCDCGKEWNANTSNLLCGTTLSCGCLGKERRGKATSERNRKYPEGYIKSPFYGLWQNFTIPSHNLTYCEEWKDFVKFYDWCQKNYIKDCELIRKNMLEPYSPENCTFLKGATNFTKERRKTSVGQKFGETEVISEDFKKEGIWYTTCKCYCGKVWDVRLKSLFAGTKSCGCLQKKLLSERNRKYPEGYNDFQFYNSWQTFHTPSYNLKYCEEWDDYVKFHVWCINNYIDGCVLTRINSSEPYSPTNCVFSPRGTVTLAEQNGVRDFIETCSSKPFSSNKTVLRGKEIDIYNDELKFGIEYCGLYWHTEDFRPNNNHHNKYLECKKNNVRLITLFSDEWKNRGKQVQGFLYNMLGNTDTKIYARKCEVRVVNNSEAIAFISEYHIQPKKSGFLVSFGIYHGDELLGVMSFGKHHRQNNDGLVLTRLVFKYGYKIVGGASKLLSRGINWAKDNSFDKIVSWSDNRWTEGDVYGKIGFKLDKEYKPSYYYVKNNIRYNKQSLTKKKLMCSGNETEHQKALSLGYRRIYDCGKKKWLLPII